MSTFQNRVWETNVYLSLGGSAVAGLIFSDITVKYRKFGSSSLTIRTLISSDWVELGGGFYVLKWPASLLDTLGKFLYTLDGVTFDNFLYDEFDVDPLPLALATIPPSKCVVSGNIVDIGGNPAFNHSITARIAELPAQSGTSIITADAIRTVPDALGNFNLILIQGSTVLLEIDRTGYRVVQIEIPIASTASLIDLLPPIV